MYERDSFKINSPTLDIFREAPRMPANGVSEPRSVAILTSLNTILNLHNCTFPAVSTGLLTLRAVNVSGQGGGHKVEPR